MSATIYVASTNPGKLRDFAVAAEAQGASDAIAFLPLPGLDGISPAPEHEDSFLGNARSKAVYYSLLFPAELVLADDSGLEVDALGGAPGVRSARYAADEGFAPLQGETVDQANNRLLLAKLASVLPTQRSARYRCVLALARDGECLLTADGSVEGEILTAPRGTGGFGYDPLFFLPHLKETMAQIDLDTKHGLSHRGRALRSLLVQFQGKTS
jgi:XTP/dITP diphosphohydrolase